ncbi:MAG: pyridoxamine 5'-phosphate oxidase [Crocinitomicaceae bacterium]|nr:pyridoxamine 5'-phosphate oxidase [Crocinitomicaceae bacterium]
MKQEEEKDLRKIRSDYQRAILLESDAKINPFDQFNSWLNDAEKEEIRDYNAFNLSTVNSDGYPRSRIVLLRGMDKSGLVFFTNYSSEKGQELAVCNKVCANFFWNMLERQVRIYGVANKVSVAESDAYFKSRPRESQIGAWASEQSSELRTRDELDEKVEFYSKKFEGGEVPRPDNWGGYRIVPHYFEFWQGGPGRLHDRIVYKVDEDFVWFMLRLAP